MESTIKHSCLWSITNMECIYKAFFQIQSILPIYYSHSHLPLNVIQFPDKNITPTGAHKTLWVIKM